MSFRVSFRFLAFLGSSVLTFAAPNSLKEVYRGHFLVGAALNESYVPEDKGERSEIVRQHFNSISPENALKWGRIHPEPGVYRFGPADRFVDFGTQHHMAIIGHTLVWHSSSPKWIFEDEKGQTLSRDALLQRMREHIHTVVGRYKGRILGWDVVNEALADDGSLRDTPWLRIIGEDYIAKAFEYAHEADPAAELYYNDFSIENPAKRRGAVALLSKLKAAGAPITGVGIQEHVNLEWPTLAELDETIAAFGRLGLKVMITELDVDVLPGSKDPGNADVNRSEAANPAFNPYTQGLPAELLAQQARRYADLFSVYLKHSGVITRVTLWGVTDAESWLNHFPIRGRTNYPLLFDRANQPKPALQALLDASPLKSHPSP